MSGLLSVKYIIIITFYPFLFLFCSWKLQISLVELGNLAPKACRHRIASCGQDRQFQNWNWRTIYILHLFVRGWWSIAYIYICIYIAKSVNISHGSLGQGVVKARLGARVTLSLSTWLHGELNKNLHKLSQIVQDRLIECGPIVDVMLSRVNFRASHHQQHGERGIKYTAACSVLLSSN